MNRQYPVEAEVQNKDSDHHRPIRSGSHDQTSHACENNGYDARQLRSNALCHVTREEKRGKSSGKR